MSKTALIGLCLGVLLLLVGLAVWGVESSAEPEDNGVYLITGEVVSANKEGLVRLQVFTSESYLAPPETVVILEVEDERTTLLLPGDVVTFKCYHQYLYLAVKESEEDRLDVWGIDDCWLVKPEIGFTTPAE